jgi:hypothetical protein
MKSLYDKIKFTPMKTNATKDIFILRHGVNCDLKNNFSISTIGILTIFDGAYAEIWKSIDP